MDDQENKQAEEGLKKELENREPQGEVLTPKPPVTCEGKTHEFRMVRTEMGIAAECLKCPVGYPLPPGAEVKNGHIYLHGELVI